MKRRKHRLLTPLALAAGIALAASGTVLAANPNTPSATGMPNQSVQGKGAQNNIGSHWEDHYQGKGNVTQTRCLGMSRGPNCITAGTRKEAARRAAAARAAAAAAAQTSATPATGGQ
jgi:hypothetical protein